MKPEDTSYSSTAGLRLLDELPETGVFRTEDALGVGGRLELSEPHVRKLLHDLSRGGWIVRLQRGLYAPADRATRVPRAHPFTIGTSVVRPAAVSHWSALAHWDLTDQIPQVVTVSSPRGTADRSRRRLTRTEESGHLWTAAGQRYRVVFVQLDDFFGSKDVWVSASERVAVYEAERAVLDMLQHFHVFQSLDPALELFKEHLADLDVERLVDYAGRLRVDAVRRRLGWVLEHLDAPEGARARLAQMLPPHPGAVALDPTQPRRGRRSQTWGVIENANG